MIDRGDTAFMLIASALVLFMTPGLAFFYGGLVRSKNVVNTMMMSYAALGLIAVQWILVGYSLAFQPGSGFPGSFLGGLHWFGLSGVGVQALAVLVTIVFSGGVTWLLLKGVNLVTPLRAEHEHEHEGLDLVDHGEKGYHELI